MANLFYLETQRGRVMDVLKVLAEKGLNTSWVEKEYLERHRMLDGEMIMWCDEDEYPVHVHLAQQDIIRKCGTKISY